MRAVDIIIKKREGRELTDLELDFLIKDYVKGNIPDYQLAAFCMAVFFRGMSSAETGYLTRAMIESGEVLDLASLKGPLIDKHSTGGVGDKVSLVLAPLAAACGLTVPMMCGRGLGHTGGTIDKLEAIPGYKTELSLEKIKQGLKEMGFVFMSQTERIVPADKLLYALRDVTGTVESIPLITASILSKKIAEGARGFVFDIKVGKGAFMKNIQDAEFLARSLVETGKSLDRKVRAVITDMNQPLGKMVGNILEVKEAVDCLRGRGPEDVMEIVIMLTASMLIMGGICNNYKEAQKLCFKHIDDGSGLEKFLQNVDFQGGKRDLLLKNLEIPQAEVISHLNSWQDGYIVSIDALKVGHTAVLIGAGRATKEEDVLASVGIELLKVQGDYVKKGDVLLKLHSEDNNVIKEALSILKSAYIFSEEKVTVKSRIIKQIKE